MNEITILQNGRIIDPGNKVDGQGDLWLRDGRIVPPESSVPERARCFNLQGKWVVPGLIDMHVHLREPGEEYKETIASGTLAAATGGFTAVACMPNTRPVNDTAAVTRFILEQAAHASARVYPVGAISKGSDGTGLAEYGELKAAGVVALSDDGQPVVDSQLMRRAMEYAASHGLLVISHSEEISLSRNGVMNEGLVSTRLGLRGVPIAAESIMVYRELALAELTGHHVHIAHVSTAAATDLIRQAKKRGVRVTAETTPHYFTLTEEAVEGYNTNAKMNPPLRTEEDRQAIRIGLQDGTFDAIATDHAPHSVLQKKVEFDRAANGIIGLETSLPLSLALVRDGVITEARLVELMSSAPAHILGVAGGSLAIGDVADITVIDPDRKFNFTEDLIASLSKNSPFLGWQLQGKAVLTLLGGRITYNDLQD
ncbi:MAG: dihydroorotase [Proteobacteria bacterium]|nr:dihydroorotase [Desulfocapsa sp.]MBU3945514.1 dihydroorotase [Pseudomonadota bacterium]MCG2745096.1 dihydroorotase [Desulfobacteraceae bacterium]MBU4029225.1 dihydroorotase [Pseudomonadota bacterium]MBU4043954.1 dihydroorotase [Pseudomonadota bacterium]